MSIIVRCRDKRIEIGGTSYPCRIGRKGFIDRKDGREGDAKTPLGDYGLRFGFYRADRLPKPSSPLTFHALREDDGWCDDPGHPAYNRFVRLPFEASHEKLWRADGVYDVILVINHNDSPPRPDLGSAVFIHVAQPDDRQTLGCVAVTPEVMVQLVRNITLNQQIQITL